MSCHTDLLGQPTQVVEHKSSPLALGKVTTYLWMVEVTESIQCPFCGQSFDLVIDTSSANQRFTSDCEVCCRPFEVFAECEPGEVLSIEVRG